jgi:1-acyl-sn-glycerol-3-phosphate acyltransferase
MADGEVFPAGRVKDLIKRGGRNLYPYDLEDAIGKVPGIRKGCVAVFGSPDPATGSERLVVVAETRSSEPDERERLRRKLNDVSVDVIGMPADDVVLAPPHSVLKTSSGKIRRVASREAYERGTLAQAIDKPWLQAAKLGGLSLGARATVAARRAGAWAYAGYAWFLFALMLLLFALPVIVLQRPATGRRVMRCGARILFRMLGAKPRVDGAGQLPRRPHVLLVNHSSYLDAIALAALLPATPGYAFSAKRDFASQWWMGRLLSGVGALLVERADARRSTADVEALAQALRRGENVIVFPEGTFKREPGLLPFHAGAFMAAALAGAPVVPAGLRGTREALRAGTWRPRHSQVSLRTGEALQPHGADWGATVRLRDTARTAIAQLSGEFAP